MRKGTPLASRVAQGVSGPSSSCVWNPRVFAPPEKDLESPSSMRLQALVPSRDSRAMTRSHSPSGGAQALARRWREAGRPGSQASPRGEAKDSASETLNHRALMLWLHWLPLHAGWEWVPLSSLPKVCRKQAVTMDCSLPGFSVHGIFQARILEWVAISFRGSSQPRDRICVSYISCIGRQVPYAPRERPRESFFNASPGPSPLP